MELHGNDILNGGTDPEKTTLMNEKRYYKEKFQKMEEAFRQSEKNVIKQ